ncbi:MAG TPA: V-type ATPase subunit [Candidatus Eisenbergiella intestinipullorum]|nr:V-type ATPase subunit [Candidatus Eisenbergiella intestinipullorum]
MSLFRYSGLSAKVRAMSGKLLTQEDFLRLGSMTGVPEVIAYLKKKPSYAALLEKEDERNLHRGQAEGLIMQSLFVDFARLYRFSNLEQRHFLDGYFMRYEISLLKAVVRSILSLGEPLTDAEEYREIFERHSAIPLKQAVNSDTMEGLIAALSGTVYKKVLNDVYGSNSRELFDYELALDLFFFSEYWKMVKKELKADDQEAIIQSAGAQIDAVNLTWIYRAKKYYEMSPAQIYALIVPIHYRLTREQIKRMAEASDLNEFLAVAETTKYARFLEGEESPKLERCMDAMQEAVHTVLLRRKPYSAACLDVYLYRKEREAHRIITAMECVRYGLPADKIREYLA